jgi:hypothetical protein
MIRNAACLLPSNRLPRANCSEGSTKGRFSYYDVMLPSERLELAIYNAVKRGSSGQSELHTSMPVLSQMTGENEHGAIAERLKDLEANGRILLTKYSGGQRWPRRDFPDRTFFHSGQFIIEIAPQGRKHFEELEQLGARRLKRKMANESKRDISDASQKILSALLAEFREKHLGVEQLRDTYQGLSPVALRSICCADERFSDVDFDLAMKELDEADLVKTGPLEPYENTPGSSVTILALISKNEYSHLTEEGYRLATRLRSSKPTKTPVPHVHISGGTFHQSPIGVGDHVSQSVNVVVNAQTIFARLREKAEEQVHDEKKRTEIIKHIDALEKAPDQLSKIERYNRLVAVTADHITVFGPLLTLLFQILTSR